MTLKELRISKGLTQLEASIICDVPLRTFKRIESDEKYQNTHKFLRIFDILNKYKVKETSHISKVITVVGLGYVGLSISVLLSQYNTVYAVDIDEDKIQKLKDKKCPFVDKEISEFLKIKKLNLIPTTDLASSIKYSYYVVIAAPTNYDNKTNEFDTSSVESLIEQIIRINPKVWIVIKSTVGVGFTKYISEKYNFNRILFSPEFLREGKALYDNLYPSRIIVGTSSKKEVCIRHAKEFASLLKEGAIKRAIVVKITRASEAEAVKLFSNAYLAMRVAYFNELDTFCQIKDLKSEDIIKGICLDPRIGDYYNNPSFGYGGYCLPKDTKGLKANFSGVPESLLSAVISSNETRKEYIANDIISRLAKNDVVGVYKLTMKSESDNFRNSSIQDVMNILNKKNINILLYEPSIDESKYKEYKVENDLSKFKKSSSIIICNRYDSSLDDVKDKVYTRDLLRRD